MKRSLFLCDVSLWSNLIVKSLSSAVRVLHQNSSRSRKVLPLLESRVTDIISVFFLDAVNLFYITPTFMYMCGTSKMLLKLTKRQGSMSVLPFALFSSVNISSLNLPELLESSVSGSLHLLMVYLGRVGHGCQTFPNTDWKMTSDREVKFFEADGTSFTKEHENAKNTKMRWK